MKQSAEEIIVLAEKRGWDWNHAPLGFEGRAYTGGIDPSRCAVQGRTVSALREGRLLSARRGYPLNPRVIFLAHNMINLAQMAKGIGLGVWAAIEEFQTAAMALEREPAG
jgi:hypothetical protein